VLDVGGSSPAGHADEPHGSGLASRLIWLRAGVLGANDGIVSTAGLVVGVAGATTSSPAIFTAGVAGLGGRCGVHGAR
jgi:VIT1/CCC1 family predicted Fe2+/Mn2+ transporter